MLALYQTAESEDHNFNKGKKLPWGELNSWRLITRITTDHKIITIALSTRMKIVLKNIMNENQVKYIKGQNISIIIWATDDVMQFINLNNTGTIIVLDYAKAFDSNNYQFLCNVLDFVDSENITGSG